VLERKGDRDLRAIDVCKIQRDGGAVGDGYEHELETGSNNRGRKEIREVREKEKRTSQAYLDSEPAEMKSSKEGVY